MIGDNPKPWILMIEDNPGDVQLFQLALSDAGLDVELTVKLDGEEALGFIQSSPGDPGNAAVPDLIVLDLNLPKYDGLSLLETIRSGSRFEKAPVIVFTSSFFPRDRARVETLSVTRYLLKPTDLEEYRRIGDTITGILSRKPRAEEAD